MVTGRRAHPRPGDRPEPAYDLLDGGSRIDGYPFRRFFVASLGGSRVLTSVLVVAGQGILGAVGLTS